MKKKNLAKFFTTSYLGFSILLTSCIYETQADVTIEPKNALLVNRSGSAIMSIEYEKYDSVGNYICSDIIEKKEDAPGLSKLYLEAQDSSYSYSNKCIIEKNFIFKLKVRTLHTVDTITYVAR